MSIQEDYVSFKTAKLLKEKGFNEQTRDFYHFENNIWIHRNTYEHNHFNLGMPRWENCYSCPTLQMAMKWLREVHKIHFLFDPYLNEDYNIRYSIIVVFSSNVVDPIYKTDGDFTYEQACEEAIRYCLENLI